jgi:hypothetical protein
MTSVYISAALRFLVMQDAGQRCGYCLSPQHLLMAKLEVEHIIPLALGGKTSQENLWLACRLCNGHKSDQTHGIDPKTGHRFRLFHPRRQKWPQHFSWAEDGAHLIGKTACGRVTIKALQLNGTHPIAVRLLWVRAGWHPPGG